MKDIQDALTEFGERLAEIAQPIAEALEGMTPEQRVVIEFLAENPEMAEAFQELNQKLTKQRLIDAERVNELIGKIHPEPRLEDERFRKAVRAWFDILPRLEDKRILYEDGALWVGVYQFDCGQYDILNTWLKSGEYYTLEELCGEEE